MKVIIPVAGVGSRLRPHTYAVPKVLLPVAGKPILSHLLDDLNFLSEADLVFIVGHLGEEVEQFVRKNYPNYKSQFVAQEKAEGLAQAVGLGLTGKENEVLVILGDTLFETDLKAVIEGKYSALAVMEVADPRRFGVVVLQDGFIRKLVEKPQEFISNQAIAGIYYFKNPALLKRNIERIIEEKIQVKGEYQITDAIQLMVEAGEKIVAFQLQGWYDCGKQETLLATNRIFLEKMSPSKANYKLENSVVIPPAFIGKKVKIRNSVVGPYISIGDNSLIEDCRIEDSIISADATVSNIVLKGSILGENTRIQGNKQSLNMGHWSQIEFL
jgi:glucose-1-phosphate thymidylyltransferase